MAKQDDEMEIVSFKVPLTRFEKRRFDALCGKGKPLKKQPFARSAILAEIERQERRLAS